MSTSAQYIAIVEFLHKVEKMRYFQKEYFSSRDKYDLMSAKRLEREIDALIPELKEAYNV